MPNVKTTKKTVNVMKGGGGPTGFVLFLAWIGALVYFVQNSEGFWGFILAVLKSAVWPAFILHKVLVLLKI